MKRRADDQKFLAQVLAIGIDCDIALLTVEDEAFWEGVTPLELGPLPTLQVSCSPASVKGHFLVMHCQRPRQGHQEESEAVQSTLVSIMGMTVSPDVRGCCCCCVCRMLWQL